MCRYGSLINIKPSAYNQKERAAIMIVQSVVDYESWKFPYFSQKVNHKNGKVFLTHKATANGWSLFSHGVFVRPSIAKIKSRYNANIEARTPCVKIMTTYWLGPGGSSLDFFILWSWRLVIISANLHIREIIINCYNNYPTPILQRSNVLNRLSIAINLISLPTKIVMFYKSELFDPLGQPKVTVGRDHCFHTCPSVRPHFSNVEKRNNRKQCSLLAWLWVWSSGSSMTPVWFFLLLDWSFHWNLVDTEKTINWHFPWKREETVLLLLAKLRSLEISTDFESTRATEDLKKGPPNFWQKSFNLLIHEADPKPRPVVITIFARVICTTVRTYFTISQNKTKFK